MTSCLFPSRMTMKWLLILQLLKKTLISSLILMKENLILLWWVQVEETTRRTAIPSSSNLCKIHLKQFLIRTCVMNRYSNHLVNWDNPSKWLCLRRLWKLINRIKSSCIKIIDQVIQIKYTSKSLLKNRIRSYRTLALSLKSFIIPQASKYRGSIPL